ncbi:MAG: esterase family protein [Acidobacteriota bacterium]|nr:esterase family protein [Acidobacteriota bacterium]
MSVSRNSCRLKHFLPLVLVCAALCAWTPPAFAAARAECASVQSAILGRSVKYCALLPASYDTAKQRRYPILYHLHGLGDNEQSFIQTGGWNVIENMQARGEMTEFITVTPAGGMSFYIDSRDGRVKYEQFFLREFLPAMEKKYRVQAGRAARGISGISMGGYGALHLAFKYPQLFGSASAHSAAIFVNPSGDSRLITGGRFDVMGMVYGSTGNGSPIDRAFYAKNSPLTLAREHAAGLRGMKIYFDCGTEDGYGFDAGTRALDAELTKLKVPHEAHLYPGRHDWVYFAEHLPASLKFHAQVFSGK